MIVKNDNYMSAAYAAYQEMDHRVSYEHCREVAELVDSLPRELPMGMSEKEWYKQCKRTVDNKAASLGILSAGIFSFIVNMAISALIKLLLKHYLSNSGWTNENDVGRGQEG